MKARVSYLSKLQKYIYSKQGSGIKPYKLCLGKVLKYFTANNIKNWMKRLRVQFFC